jgi:hypothetical protein
MSVVDININREVRRIFVRHWIDLGRISTITVNGQVTIRGTVQVLPGVATPVTAKTLENIVADIRRIPNLRTVRHHFTNWVFTNGVWNSVRTDESSPGTSEPDAKPNLFSIE